MAGTDKRFASPGTSDRPAIILIDPQLGENIGMVARAMLNCGLTCLRLVRPRDGWPSEKAIAASSGADDVVNGATLYDTTEDAIADLNTIYATTARPRDMVKRIVTPEQAADEIAPDTSGIGIIFGGEAKGLKNDDVALADAVIMAPLNPAFASLNLAQAVLLVSHELYKRRIEVVPEMLEPAGGRPATKEELTGLYEHLEGALDDSGFFHVREKRAIMSRNIRNIFGRANMLDQEVRTLRGVITSLVRYKPKRPK